MPTALPAPPVLSRDWTFTLQPSCHVPTGSIVGAEAIFVQSRRDAGSTHGRSGEADVRRQLNAVPQLRSTGGARQLARSMSRSAESNLLVVRYAAQAGAGACRGRPRRSMSESAI